MQTKSYTAKNIIIKNQDVFDFGKIASIAQIHSKPLEFVRRGFEACRLAGVHPDFFVNKYILKKNAPQNKTVEAVYREILNENMRTKK